MKFLIIDLEATCWENSTREQRDEMEIIEIGGAVVEPYSLKLLDSFSIMVKPVFHPKLSPFCTDLTSITQKMVDEGTDSKMAIDKLSAYIDNDDIFCSWGLFDCKMIYKHCSKWSILYPFKNSHANIKTVVAQATDQKPCSVSRACNFFDINFQGRQHRGINDAVNMRTILEKADDYLEKKDVGVTMTSLIIEEVEKNKEITDYPFFGSYKI